MGHKILVQKGKIKLHQKEGRIPEIDFFTDKSQI